MPPPTSNGRPYVLVIDDDDDIREGLMVYLEDHGFCPLGAANGQRALAMLANPAQRPCAIVLDLMMPVMDGRMFREEQLRFAGLADIPVVLISAYANLTAVAHELSIADYLTKPIDPRALVRVICDRCGSSATASGPSCPVG